MKPTILMLPSWYPTPENPFVGSFFREQALALLGNFNFLVLTCRTKKEPALFHMVKSLLGLNKPRLCFVQDDGGLQEFSLSLALPQAIVWDVISERLDFIVKRRHLALGVGKKECKSVGKARAKAIRYIKKHGLLPDFDCVYSLTAQAMANLGNDFSKIYSVPHVTAEHAPFPWPGQVLADYTVESIERADAFLAVSNDKIRQVLLQNIKVNPVWVGNLCDETKFRLSSKHDVPTFLIVAAYAFFKNYPLFIKAMEELKRIATKDFKIVIAGYDVGGGYSQNSKELENLVAASSIAGNTTMIGSVSRTNMPSLYSSCDVFVMTSIQEGLPVSALEASMSGLPVIATRCGGVEDYIDDSMGRILPITDWKGIAQACNQILNKEVEFDAGAIRERTVSKFGRDAFVSRMSNVFYGVMSSYREK